MKKKYELRIKFYGKSFGEDRYTVEYCYYRFFQIWKKIWIYGFDNSYYVMSCLSKKESIEELKKLFNNIYSVRNFIKKQKDKEKAYKEKQRENKRLEKEKAKSCYRIL